MAEGCGELRVAQVLWLLFCGGKHVAYDLPVAYPVAYLQFFVQVVHVFLRSNIRRNRVVPSHPENERLWGAETLLIQGSSSPGVARGRSVAC